MTVLNSALRMWKKSVRSGLTFAMGCIATANCLVAMEKSDAPKDDNEFAAGECPIGHAGNPDL